MPRGRRNRMSGGGGGARATTSNLANAIRKAGDPNHVPKYDSTIRFKHHYRFMYDSNGSTHGSTFDLTRKMLLDLIQVNLAGGTGAARVCASVKLNRVEMRSYDSTHTTPISWEWLSQYGPGTEVSDTAIGVSPAYFTTSPPARSVASFWSLSGLNESEVLARIKYSIAGTQLIDIWVDCVLFDEETPVALTNHNTGTAAEVYVSPLDGINQVVASWPPVSYSTTF